MSLLHQLEETALHYSNGSKKTIASFLLENEEQLQQYTMNEIADRTYSSKAALSRFAKGMGFTGWKEFIDRLLEEIRYQKDNSFNIDPNYPFDMNSSTNTVIDRLCTLEKESLDDTKKLMDEKVLCDVVEELTKANRIVLFGSSPNSYIAHLFRRKMLAIGKNVEVAQDDDTGLKANTLCEKDCCFVISYSGSNPDRRTPHFFETLKKSGAEIIAITSFGDNELSEMADHVLRISSKENLFSKIATFSTETSILFILNTIYALYFQKEYQENVRNKTQLSRDLEMINRANEDLDE